MEKLFSWKKYCGGIGMTWVEKHGINCYSCNKLFDEREAIHVEIKNEDHEICEECAEESE